MRMAYDAFHHLFDWDYVAFDSFEGLPEISEIDRQEIWSKGKLKTTEEEFIEICIKHGMPRNKLITIKGFYENSLTPELKESLLCRKAAVVYIDCDLYMSTVPILNWITEFLQKGTVIVFDDWNCFCGDSNRGERRAFAEYRAQQPELVFEPFLSTGETQSFICIGRKEDSR